MKTLQYWHNLDNDKRYVINERGKEHIAHKKGNNPSSTMYRGFKKGNLLQRSTEKGDNTLKETIVIAEKSNKY
jgi:hypothetical protein